MNVSSFYSSPVRPYHPIVPTAWSLRQKKNIKTHSKLAHQENVTVGSLLRSCKPTPANSVLLGKCQDGLPLLLELGDPQMGAVLISGDGGCGKTHHLQVIVQSAVRMAQAGNMQIAVLTANLGEWAGVLEDEEIKRYMRGIYAWYDPRVAGLIANLTDLAEARRQGERQGSAIIFVMDDLNFAEGLGCEAQFNFRWLISYGSQSNIWLVAGIHASYASSFQYWLEPFRTRVVGRTKNQEDAALMASGYNPGSEVLEPGTFSVQTGESRLTYQLPLLGDPLQRKAG